MLNGLYYAHSGLRYLIIVVGLVTLLYALVGLLTKRPYDKGMRILGAAFPGLIHLQILLGLGVLMSGRFYPAIWFHFIAMLLAAVCAQLPASVMRRRPPEERVYGPHVVLTAIALSAIFIGISVIGRGLFGTTAL